MFRSRPALAALTALLIWTVGSPARGAGDASWPDLSAPAAMEGGGENDAAVVIGVEDYVVVSDIPGARQNAQDWYTWLVDTRKVPVGSVVLLRDTEGTREGILDGAQRARERVKPGGTLWFVYIGHGAPGKDGTDGLLVGWDTQQTANSVYARGLPQSELLAELEQGPQASTLLVLDACFSGRTGSGDAIVHGLQPLIPDYSVQPRTATVVTAGRADQFAGPLPGAGRPAFSYLMLGALRGWGDANADRQVSAQEAVDYSVSALYALVRDRSQTPEIHGPGAATVLSGGHETGPNLRELVVQLGPGGASPPAGEETPKPDGEASTEGGLMGELEELRRRQQERGDALQTETARVQGEARDAWAVTCEIASGGGAEAELALRKFLEAYDGCAVTVGGQTHPVTIAEVPDARAWLARVERGETAPPWDDGTADPPPPDPPPAETKTVDITTPQGMMDLMGDMVDPAFIDPEDRPMESFSQLGAFVETSNPEAEAYLMRVLGLMETGAPSVREFADMAVFYGSATAEQERLVIAAAEELALSELRALPPYQGDASLRDAAAQAVEYGVGLSQGPCREIVQLVRGAEHKGDMSELVLSSIELRLMEIDNESLMYQDMLLLAVEQFAFQWGISLDDLFGPIE